MIKHIEQFFNTFLVLEDGTIVSRTFKRFRISKRGYKYLYFLQTKTDITPFIVIEKEKGDRHIYYKIRILKE